MTARHSRVTHSCVHRSLTTYMSVSANTDKTPRNYIDANELRLRFRDSVNIDELDGDPEYRQQKLRELRDMFKCRPDIVFRKDGMFLLQFLRSNKFVVDRSFKTLLYHYEVRKNYGEIFEDYRPSAVPNFSECSAIFVCPGKDHDKRKVIVMAIGYTHEMSTEQCPIVDQVRATLMTVETVVTDRDIQRHGVTLVIDCGEMIFRKMKLLGPQMLRKIIDVCVNAMPMTVGAVHVVRQPELCDSILPFIDPLIPKNISNKIYLHGDDYGTLHDHIPSAILPSDLGGQLLIHDNSEWANATMAAEEEFVHNEQFGFIKSKSTEISGEITAHTHLGK